ncbi:MAG: class I SAM-dependent methyltransferase [Dehalococcoidia bacterium]
MIYDEWKDLASYYDELYVKPEQYQKEAQQVVVFSQQYLQSGGNTLLDVACGTGGHIKYLQDHFQVSGVDLSESMLGVARKKFPHLPLYHGNMVDFSLDKQFDIIICMYGSIGIVKTYANLKLTLQNMVRHLLPGGLVIIVPWSTTESFKEKIVVDAVKHPHIRIARMENVKRKATNLVEITFHHLIGEKGQVEYHTQCMEVGLFSHDEYISSIQEAGLQLVEIYEGPNISMGAFVGRLKI